MSALSAFPAAQDLFGEREVVAGHLSRPAAVALGDIDGDDDLDVIVGTDERLVWVANGDGSGPAAPERTIAFLTWADGLAIGDADGDGDADVFSSGGPAGTLSTLGTRWFENLDGAGTFDPVGHALPGGTGPTVLELEDFDGDGDLDNLSIVGGSTWYENVDGAGTYIGPFDLDAFCLDARTADVDGDGDVDVWCMVSNAFKHVSNEFDTGGTFAPPQTTWVASGSSWLEAFDVCDFDLDGDLDTVSVDYGHDLLVWNENVDGLGSLGAQQVLATTVVFPQDVRATDLDGDGDPDPAVASKYGDFVEWYANDGAGSVGPQHVISTATDVPERIAVGDLDGDLDPDILSLSPIEGSVEWFENTDGLGAFGPRQLVLWGAAGVGASVALDVDEDGDDDIVAAQFYGGLHWYEQLPTGAFAPPRELEDPPGRSTRLYPVDVDLDGDLDFVTSQGEFQYPLGDLKWLEREGTLDYTAHLIASPIDDLRSVAVGDVTGDGAPEVFTAVSPGNVVSWYANDGAGTFGAEQVVPATTSGLRWVELGDVDGDGDLDPLTGSVFDSKVAWNENLDGLGDFAGSVTVAPVGAWRLRVVDADEDGDNDILAARRYDVRWLRNDGGVFVELPDFADDQSMISGIEVADVDADGDLDVLVASEGEDGGELVAWYAHDAALSFSPMQVIDTVTSDGASVADLDRDGDLDVVSVSHDSYDYSRGRVYLYRNTTCEGPAVAAAEVVRVGTPPNPAALLPGATSAPVIGSVWDPRVEHTTFLPGALVDFLVVSFAPANLDLGAPGTLLCDLTAAPVITLFHFAPGTPFAIPVGFDCASVGTPVCVQGGAIDATGALALTNALDVVVGSY